MKIKAYLIGMLVFVVSASTAAIESQCPVLKPYTQAEFQEAFLKHRNNKGVFLKLRKNQKTYYLYGTIHATKLENINLGDDVNKAINNSTGVAVETDISDPKNKATLARSNAANKPIKLSQPTKALFTKLEQQYCVHDINYQHASSIDKAYYLSMYKNALNGYFFGFGADSIIINTAKKLNKPIISLEMVEEQQAMLSAYDDAVVRHILESVVSDTALKQLEIIDDAWLHGDTKLLTTIKNSYDGENASYVNNLMSRQRDYNLAKQIDAFYQTHDNGFAAIGVLHLVGDDNVVDNLQQRGYQVTYILPTNG